MAELRVKVPIRFSEKAQRDLYETCMGYKELAEMRGAENAKLRELVRDMYDFIESTDDSFGDVTFSDCFDYCEHDTTDDGCCKTGECWYERRMRELGLVDA